MKSKDISALEVYPENREAIRPTTSKIFDIFNGISTYTILEDNKMVDKHADDLTEVQKLILQLMSIDEGTYWQGMNEKII